MSRQPSIPWDRIRAVLACYPDGLPTTEIAALAAPGPAIGKTPPALLCHSMLKRHEALGHVRRVRHAPLKAGGSVVVWSLKATPAPAREPATLSEERRAIGQAYALELRRLALMQRRAAALAKIVEGIEELEQADRELAALGLMPRLCR